MDKKVLSNKSFHLDHTTIMKGMDADSSYASESVWQSCSESIGVYLRALRAGRLRGMVTLVGCNDADADQLNAKLVEELLQRDIWIAVSDCATETMDNKGITGFDAIDFAGEGLAEFCDNLDVPPVVQIRAGAGNEQLVNLYEMLAEQSGVEITNLPIAAIVPEHSLLTSTNLQSSGLADIYGTILTIKSDAMETADFIDAQIRKVRRAIQWCDRYHCTIHS
jgi:hypothetical protein